MAKTPPGDDTRVAIDTEEFEKLLRERREALWQDIRRELRKHDREQHADFVEQGASDLEDRAFADLLVHLNLTEVDRDVTELRAVQAALGRIESGSYGLCASCGRTIDPERLRAIPETPLCIDCASRAERHTAETPSL